MLMGEVEALFMGEKKNGGNEKCYMKRLGLATLIMAEYALLIDNC